MNWFRPGDQRRDAGEPAILAGITRQVMSDFAVDPERVYIAGLSAGGAMAAVMAATYPELYAAAGVHSGLAYRAARDVPFRVRGDAERRVTGAGRRGTADRLPRRPRQHRRACQRPEAHRLPNPCGRHGIIDGAAQQGLITTHDRETGGHRYSQSVYRDTNDTVVAEQWIVHGGSHAWFGGNPVGSYTDARG